MAVPGCLAGRRLGDAWSVGTVVTGVQGRGGARVWKVLAGAGPEAASRLQAPGWAEGGKRGVMPRVWRVTLASRGPRALLGSWRLPLPGSPAPGGAKGETPLSGKSPGTLPPRPGKVISSLEPRHWEPHGRGGTDPVCSHLGGPRVFAAAWKDPPHPCTHTCAHTGLLTYMRCAHTLMYKLTCLCVWAHGPCTQAHMCLCVHTSLQMCTGVWACTPCTHAHTCMCMCAHILTCPPLHMHTQVFVCTRPCLQTHACGCVCTCICMCVQTPAHMCMCVGTHLCMQALTALCTHCTHARTCM